MNCSEYYTKELELILTETNIDDIHLFMLHFLTQNNCEDIINDEEKEKEFKKIFNDFIGKNTEVVFVCSRIFIALFMSDKNEDFDSFFSSIAKINKNIFDILNSYMTTILLINENNKNSKLGDLLKNELLTDFIIEIIDSAIIVIKNKNLYEYCTILFIKLIFIINYLYNRASYSKSSLFIDAFKKPKRIKINIPEDTFFSFSSNLAKLNNIISKNLISKSKFEIYNIIENIYKDLGNIRENLLKK